MANTIDILQMTSVLIILKNTENNGTEKIALLTPIPDDAIHNVMCIVHLILHWHHMSVTEPQITENSIICPISCWS